MKKVSKKHSDNNIYSNDDYDDSKKSKGEKRKNKKLARGNKRNFE